MKKVYLQIMQVFGLIIYLSFVFGALVIHVNAAPTANPGDIIINEIMNNSNAVGDTEGEWIEIVNISGSIINIDGWTLEDDGGDNHTISNGGTLNVTPGDYFVLCRNGDTILNGGVSCDYAYGPSFDFQLSNSADEVILFEGTTEIARVNYTGASPWPDPNGASMAYSVPTNGDPIGNNIATNWADSSTTTPPAGQWPGSAGDQGTPGERNQDWMGPNAINLQTFSGSTPSVLPILAGFVLIVLFTLVFGVMRYYQKPNK